MPDCLLIRLSFRMYFWVRVSLECVYPFSAVPDVVAKILPLWTFTTPSSLVECLLFLFHEFIKFMEVDIRKHGGEYTSYKVANLPIEVSTSIPRTQLRPGYGDGFLGAPLQSVPAHERSSPRMQGGPRGTSRTPRQHNPGGAQHV